MATGMHPLPSHSELLPWMQELSTQLRADVREEMQCFIYNHQCPCGRYGWPRKLPDNIDEDSQQCVSGQHEAYVSGQHQGSRRNLLVFKATTIAKKLVASYPGAQAANAHKDGQTWQPKATVNAVDVVNQRVGHYARTSQMELLDRRSLMLDGIDEELDDDELDGLKVAKPNLVEEFVQGGVLDNIAGILVLLNMLTVGLEVDFEVRTGSTAPRVFRILNNCFCFFFATELALKLFVYRTYFFTMQDKWWNMFDLILVTMQLVDMWYFTVSAVPKASQSMARTARFLRVGRVCRGLRVLHLFSEVRHIMASLQGSITALFWVLLVMFIIIFMVSVIFTQLVLFTLQDDNTPATAADELRMWYGSLGRTILTLAEAIFSGLDWDEAIVPLIDHVSPFAGIAFGAYVLFAMLAMLNIVTGVFVEKAMQNTQEEEEDFLVHHLCLAFHHLDKDLSGELTSDEFEGVMQTEGMRSFFKLIDVDLGESQGVFRLLDADGSGSIDALEFISGCLRLRGPAKAVDLSILTWRMKQMNEMLRVRFEILERALGRIGLISSTVAFPHDNSRNAAPGHYERQAEDAEEII